MPSFISRRELLRRFGLTAASLPLLDALGNRAYAEPAAPRRMVTIVVRHGVFTQHLLPFVPMDMPIGADSPGNLLMAPKDFLRPVPFEQRENCTAIDLMPHEGWLGAAFSARWQPLKAKTAFIHNLGNSNAQIQGHTWTAMLGGYQNGNLPDNGGPIFTGETLDVVVARKLTGRLPMGLKCPDTVDDMRFLEEPWSLTVKQNATGFEYVPSQRNPAMVWDRLFSDFTPPVAGPPKRDRDQRRVALLDRTLANIHTIERDRRLSAYDKVRLENHAAFLSSQREHAAALKPPTAATATPPPRPSAAGAVSEDAFQVDKGMLFRAQFKNAAAAIKMNKEQVITIDTALENGWVTEDIALSGNYHGNGGHLVNPSLATIEEIRKIHQLIFDTIADFLTELDVLEDPATGKTYLDNTFVLITNEHDGQPNGHLRASVPSILAGGFGTFQGGKLYEYSVPALRSYSSNVINTSLSYTRLLYTMIDAFGVTSDERAKMDLQGLPAPENWMGSDLTGWNLPLPGLT